MTKDYFHSTSHRGQECLTQMLRKQNRLEHLQHLGAKQSKKFEMQCSNCNGQGHNRLLCQITQDMRHCNLLQTSYNEGKKVPRCQNRSKYSTVYYSVYRFTCTTVKIKSIGFFLLPSPRTNLSTSELLLFNVSW